MWSSRPPSEPRAAWARRHPAIVPLAIILLALGLRVQGLDFQPLWWDEGYSLFFATNPVGEMLSQTAQDIHPPLYYLLLRGWIFLFGPGPATVRLLSTAIGVLTVPLAYVTGRRVGGDRVAILAALILAINPIQVFYSQEVRMYGLVALLSLASILCAILLLRPSGVRAEQAGLPVGRGRRRVQRTGVQIPMHRTAAREGVVWLAYVGSTAAALYTQYYVAFIPVALTLYALWRCRRWPRLLLRWLGAQVAVVLLYLPWLLYAAPQLVPYVAQKVVKDADQPLGAALYLARHLAAFAGGHAEGWLAQVWWLGLCLLPLLGWGLWRLVATKGQGAPQREGAEGDPHAEPGVMGLLLSALVVPLALGYVLNLRYPFFPERGERLLLLAQPAYVLLLATAVRQLLRSNRWVGQLALALIVVISALGLGALFSVPRYVDDDYRPLIESIVERGRPDDRVFCIFPWQVGYLRSYAPGAAEAILSPGPAWGSRVEEALDIPLMAGHHLWFPAHLALGGILEQAVEAHLLSVAYPLANEWHGPHTRLLGFTPGQPTASSVGSIDFGGELQLLESRWAPPLLTADNAALAVDLTWKRADTASPDARVSLRLADDRGVTWARRDSAPVGGLQEFGGLPLDEHLQDRHGLLVSPGTPPGTYDLLLEVPAGGEGQALNVLQDGRPAGTEVLLGTVQVTMPTVPVSPMRLAMDRSLAEDLAGLVRFLGYSVGQDEVMPGEVVDVSLFWQTTSDLQDDYVAFVQLLDGQDAVLSGWEAPPGAAYETSRWRRGDLVRTQAVLRLPATVPDGTYRLISGLFRADNGERLQAGRRDHIELRSIDVRGREHRFIATDPTHEMQANFGDVLTLVGYDLSPSGPVTAGQGIRLTLHWRAESLMNTPYSVFVHLLDGGGQFRGQSDGPPGGGRLPTSGWLVGEYVVDARGLTVGEEAEAGSHVLEVGLYDPLTGNRLPLLDGQGNILADRVLLEQTPITVTR